MASDIIEYIFTVFNNILSGFFLKILFALIVILVGFVIGRMIGKLITRLLHEIEFNSIYRKATKRKEEVDELIGSFVSYIIYIIVIVLAFNRLGITRPIAYTIIIMFFVIILIAFLLAVRDIIPNMIAGFSIKRRGFLKVGDRIVVKGMKGKIISLELAETRIETDSGDLISIPNTIMVRNEVRILGNNGLENYSKH